MYMMFKKKIYIVNVNIKLIYNELVGYFFYSCPVSFSAANCESRIFINRSGAYFAQDQSKLERRVVETFLSDS